MLTRLAQWVAGVYLRYPDARLPDCWLWHPEVVEELLWLHQAWLAAYAEGARVTAAADWHDRYRPGVLARIKSSADMCALDDHQPGRIRHRPARTAPVAGRAAGDRRVVVDRARQTRTRAQPGADHRRQPGPPQRRPAMTSRTDDAGRPGDLDGRAGRGARRRGGDRARPVPGRRRLRRAAPGGLAVPADL